jgi:hypothetical protein
MRAKAPRRLIAAGAAAALSLAVLAAAYVGLRAVQAREDLAAAAAAADTAAAALELGDLDAASDALAVMTARASAVDIGGDPLWRAAEVVPGVGPNLTAARVSASGLSRLGRDVAMPLLEVSRDLQGADPMQLVGVLSGAADTLRRADEVRADVEGELSELDRDTLIGPVATGLTAIEDVVASAQSVTSGAAQAATLLPQILGADGPRTVLLMVQNTAELRTGGGITGTFVQLDADGGRLTLAGIRDSTSFAPAAEPLLPLRAGEARSFGDGIGRFVQDASMTADFTLSARLASEWWSAATGVVPDAVVSVDPVVMAAVLRATGPVDMPGEAPLGADDVVPRLLVQPYLTLTPEEQGTRFAAAATAVFTALVDRADPLALATALRGPIDEGRISVWSAHPEEQAAIAHTVLAGPLARQRAAGDDAFAVYFNDATGGKLTPYLEVGMGIAAGSCRADARPEVVVSVELGSGVPADAVATLPASVTGGGIWGAAVGDIAPTVTVVAPPGWYLGGVHLDGELVPAVAVSDDGQPAVTRRTDLAPGRTRTLSFHFVAPDADRVDPEMLHTPLLAPPSELPAPEVCRTS